MDIKRKRELRQNLKIELETIKNDSLSQKELSDAVFNLSGFFRVLHQMKKEAKSGQI